MKIINLQADMRNVDIRFRVIQKGEIRDVSINDGKSLRLSEVIIGDDTGRIYLTLWDQSIDLLKIGDIAEVKNGFIKVIRQELRLNVGKYGELIKIEKDDEFVPLGKIPETFAKPPTDYKPKFRRFVKKHFEPKK